MNYRSVYFKVKLFWALNPKTLIDRRTPMGSLDTDKPYFSLFKQKFPKMTFNWRILIHLIQMTREIGVHEPVHTNSTRQVSEQYVAFL